jgi:hypothetical protein
MLQFLESNIGQIIARNGILAVILAVMMWQNHGLVERLFTIVENNTKAFYEVKEACSGGDHGRE